MKGELLLLSSVIFLFQRASGCPQKCRCHSPSHSVDCSLQGLVVIPSDLPLGTLVLNLQDNQIHQLPAFAFQSMPQLTALNLCNNTLSQMAPEAFHGLPHLQILNLSQNSLHSLESNLFQSLPQLRVLDLSSNNIRHLPTSLGGPWENLTVFAIQNNWLQQLNRALLETMPRMKLLFLKDNLWQCSCHLLGLKLWLEKFIYKGGVTDGIACMSPDAWKGEDLLKIPHELYPTCSRPTSDLESSGRLQPGSPHQAVLRTPEDHAECELRPKPRPANLRHAVTTVVITGVVCGIVCLLMLAAAIYGCTYAALTAQCHRGPPRRISGAAKVEGKDLFDSLPA